MKRIGCWMIAAVLLLGMAGGTASCADRSRSVEMRTVEPGSATATGGTVVERRVETREVDDDGGVISGIFDIVGDILSLPFRLVAGLFRVIF
ncbi:MAG: hypothetical protein HY714_03060 [Candidatus Omnitrophica bacterium]|nr:hypothetical protein [Candidatus Omnitrophota bacterium]